MKYLLLIYDREATWEALDEAQCQALMGDYRRFTDDLRGSGRLLAGEALQPVATATTVRVREGRLSTTDGPFAETKEQLGGFYMVEAANLDEAIALAGRIPSARLGCVEVRPVMTFE